MTDTEKETRITPHMPEPAIEALSARLKNSKSYLEYGSGGSTVLAASLGVPRIVSVDTSVEWFKKVRDEIDLMGYGGELRALHIDIGPTKKWGYPVNDARMGQWPRYFFEPWALIQDGAPAPDLILIDGRFRVSCFLASLAHAPVGTTILFDDYVGRKHYHVVERLLKPINHYDRMVEFAKVSEPSAALLLTLLAEVVLDPR